MGLFLDVRWSFKQVLSRRARWRLGGGGVKSVDGGSKCRHHRSNRSLVAMLKCHCQLSPHSTRHRALSIREVVGLACYHLLPGMHDAHGLAEVPRGRKALLALASTCKVLQTPALDALWRHQDDIVPWLSCFPDDLFNMRPALASEESPLVNPSCYCFLHG
jgi:hypothetical protein